MHFIGFLRPIVVTYNLCTNDLSMARTDLRSI